MKLFKKLGQTATEYLIILAVVIVIALIVVGVMGGIPGVGKGGKKGVDQAYWSTAPVGIEQAGISASIANPDVLKIKNNQNDVITVNNITFQQTGQAAVQMVPETILAAGEAKIINPTLTDLVCTATNSFSYEVVITYTQQSTGKTFTDSGHAIAGTCAN